jgi:hypothetical protein
MFGALSTNYINWMAARYIIDAEKKEVKGFIDGIRHVTTAANLRVREECLAAGGKFKW